MVSALFCAMSTEFEFSVSSTLRMFRNLMQKIWYLMFNVKKELTNIKYGVMLIPSKYLGGMNYERY